MEKVSIILPVYNVAKYLDRCIESLQKQSYKNIELIFVNDGSPDNSGEIIEKYARDDERIKHVITTNQGLSSARNNGIPHVTGKYLMFVDSDDYLPEDAIERMVFAMEEQEADLVVGSYDRIYEGVKESELQKNHTFARMNTQYSGKSIFEAPELIVELYHAAWGKLYHADLFIENADLRFMPGIWYEDMQFFLRVLPRLKKIVLLDEVVYNYIVREGSIMTTNSDKMFDMFMVLETIIADLKEKDVFEQFYEEIEFVAMYHVLIGTTYRISKAKGMPKIKNMKKTFDFYKTTFPTFNKNKYLKAEPLFYKTFVNTAYMMGNAKSEEN